MRAKANLSTGAIKDLARKSRVQDTDNEVALVVQAIIDSTMTTGQISEAALKLGLHISAATMENWLKPNGVRNPHNRTIYAAFAGMGWITKRIPPRGWRLRRTH